MKHRFKSLNPKIYGEGPVRNRTPKQKKALLEKIEEIRKALAERKANQKK